MRSGGATLIGLLTMFDAEPLPRRGVLRKGVIYRVPAPPGRKWREPDPEVVEIIRRVEEAKIRAYLEKRKRRRKS